METIQKINGITAEIEIENNSNRSWLDSYPTIEKMIEDMTSRDIILKGANVGKDFITVSLEKTDQANENDYENSMRIDKDFPRPNLDTRMYK